VPAAHRLGDPGSGHGCFPPRNNVQGSPNVFVNGIPSHRVGDAWAVHCCPDNGCHASVMAVGSSTVFVNGKPKARVGDAVACGSVAVSGSSNVFVG
jgi:uncharacterized Zn-binding protein involved in type VI secretion